jgi:hypothetical protein
MRWSACTSPAVKVTCSADPSRHNVPVAYGKPSPEPKATQRELSVAGLIASDYDRS